MPADGSVAPRNRPVRRTGRATPYLFLAPFLVLFIGFVLLPAVYGIWVSLHDYDYLLPGKPWVGLQNYTDLFDSAGRDAANFWHSMEATGIFTVLSVPFLLVLPLGLALLLNRAFPGRTFFRAVFFTPYVLGVAVVGVLFRFILEPTIGIVNYYLGLLHLPQPAWTTSTPWVWVTLVGHDRVVDDRVSTRSSTWPVCRTSRPTSTRPPRSTGPASGSSSGTSRCRVCGRSCCSC